MLNKITHYSQLTCLTYYTVHVIQNHSLFTSNIFNILYTIVRQWYVFRLFVLHIPFWCLPLNLAFSHSSRSMWSTKQTHIESYQNPRMCKIFVDHYRTYQDLYPRDGYMHKSYSVDLDSSFINNGRKIGWCGHMILTTKIQQTTISKFFIPVYSTCENVYVILHNTNIFYHLM